MQESWQAFTMEDQQKLDQSGSPVACEIAVMASKINFKRKVSKMSTP